MQFVMAVMLSVLVVTSVPLAQPALNVSVAASVSDVMGEVAKAFHAATGTAVRLNVGSSNVLARQIREGAPVDVFFSADEAQMDLVERAGRLVPGSRQQVLANQLALIRPATTRFRVESPADLVKSEVRRVALGNPESVPAGVYARQWLEKLKLWPAVRDKVIPLSTVRAALAAVRESRVQAGVVYVTDTRGASGIEVVYVVPVAEGPSISYPAAAVRGRHEDAARKFVQFLKGDIARRLFEAAGFAVVRHPARAGTP